MKRLLRFLFPRRQRLIDLPEAFGERLSCGEITAALHAQNDTLAVRALAQIIYYRSVKLCDAGKKDAWKGNDTRYQLGGANALDELLEDVQALCDAGTLPDDLREFFKAK